MKATGTDDGHLVAYPTVDTSVGVVLGLGGHGYRPVQSPQGDTGDDNLAIDLMAGGLLHELPVRIWQRQVETHPAELRVVTGKESEKRRVLT